MKEIIKKHKSDIVVAIISLIFYICMLYTIAPEDINENIPTYSYWIWGIISIMLFGFLEASIWYFKQCGRILFIDLMKNENKSIFTLLKDVKNNIVDYSSSLTPKSTNNATGIILGRKGKKIYSSPEDEPYHVAVVGGTRTGKTSAVGIPTLRNWQGNVFAIDIAGDLTANCERDPAIIDLTDCECSYGWDVFASVEYSQTRDEQLEKLAQLGFMIIPDEASSDASNYFKNGARKLLIGSLIYYFDHEYDFISICEKIIEDDAAALINTILSSQNEDAKKYVGSFRGTNEKNTAGCKEALDNTITLFATNKLIQDRMGGNLSPSSIEMTDILVRLDQDKLVLYAPFIRIVTTQIIMYLSQRKKKGDSIPILIMLDEFRTLGNIDHIIEAFGTLAKRNVRIMIMIQSMNDLNDVYGTNQARIIMDNCGYKIVLKASDPSSQEYFSALCGEYESKKSSHTWSISKEDSFNESTERIRNIPPASLGFLKDDLIMIAPDGYLKLEKAYYFK